MAGTPAHAHFLETPWCASLLTAPDTRLHSPGSLSPKPSTEDSLFSTTLQTPTTITHALTFYPRPHPSSSSIPAATTLLSLGSALNGHPHILHGGIVAAILDEAMGILLNLNLDLEHVRAVALGHRHGEVAEPLASFTVELKIAYKRPVSTPGLVAARAEIVRVEGRKVWVRAVLGQRALGAEGEGMGQGGVMEECAVGEALFVEPRSTKI